MHKNASENPTESESNYPIIFAGFKAKGIPESQILPRRNVLTFSGWKSRGRVVRRGEKGVNIVVFSPGETKNALTPRFVPVFHESQLVPIAA